MTAWRDRISTRVGLAFLAVASVALLVTWGRSDLTSASADKFHFHTAVPPTRNGYSGAVGQVDLVLVKIQRHAFGCPDLELTKNLMRLHPTGDRANADVFAVVLTGLVLDRRCRFFDPGEELFFSEVFLSDRLYKLRPRGEVGELFVSAHFVQ